MREIIELLIASGIGGVIAAITLVIFLKPAVKSSIEHSYQKLLEKIKTDQVLVQKRYDVASAAVHELVILHQDIVSSVNKYECDETKKYASRLISEVHPQYRAKYRAIRSRLETTNDLLSFYGMSFDAILHPETIKIIFTNSQELKTPSDYRYAYKTIWLAIVESMHALVKVSGSHQFWDPDITYAERARAWAEYEKKLMIQHFIARFSGEFDDAGFFCMQIEKDDGTLRFWSELPDA